MAKPLFSEYAPERCTEHGPLCEGAAGGDHIGTRPTLFPEIASHTANKFHDGNGDDGKHYWLTPPELYASLDAEFHFDFDPCPYPLPDGFDGLTCEWGQSNYVNPPFGSIWHEGRLKGPTAWVRKAIAEHRKGKTVVLVYPIDKWVLMLLDVVNIDVTRLDVRNLGDVRWLATEDGSAGNGTGRHIACFVLTAPSSFISKRLDATRCLVCGHRLDDMGGCDSCAADREAEEWEGFDRAG